MDVPVATNAQSEMSLSGETIQARLERLEQLLDQLCEPWRGDLRWTMERAVAGLEPPDHGRIDVAASTGIRRYAVRTALRMTRPGTRLGRTRRMLRHRERIVVAASTS